MTSVNTASEATSFKAENSSCTAYPADLYKPDGLAPVYENVDALDAEAIASYKELGYLAVADVYSPQMVEQAKEALRDIIVGSNMEFNELTLENFKDMKDKSKDDPIFKDPARMEAIVRKVVKFTQVDARLKAMAEYQPLLNMVEKLAGEKMLLSQEMALLKPPGGKEKPWHQDHAYFNVDNSKRFVGVWIALDSATVANGCMHIMPGKHHEPVIHFKRRDWQICDNTSLQMKNLCLAVPLEPGGVLFFDSFLPHGTPTNQTDQRRRALQFHFKPITATEITTQDRMNIWGAEGKDVEC